MRGHRELFGDTGNCVETQRDWAQHGGAVGNTGGRCGDTGNCVGTRGVCAGTLGTGQNPGDCEGILGKNLGDCEGTTGTLTGDIEGTVRGHEGTGKLRDKHGDCAGTRLKVRGQWGQCRDTLAMPTGAVGRCPIGCQWTRPHGHVDKA